jgi:reactive intermediate/imine deaminase
MRAFAASALFLASSVGAAPPQYFATLPGNPAPVSDAVRVGDILYLSGQIGRTADGKMPDTFDGQAKQVMENVGAVLKRNGHSFGDVFKCTVFIVDMKNWPAFNAVYVPYFRSGKLPARSAVGVTGLALGAKVELECLAYAGKK